MNSYYLQKVYKTCFIYSFEVYKLWISYTICHINYYQYKTHEQEFIAIRHIYYLV